MYILLLLFVLVMSFVCSSGPVQWMDNGFFLYFAETGDYFYDTVSPLFHPFYHFVIVGINHLFGNHILSYFNAFLSLPLSFLIFRLSLDLGADNKTAIACTVTALLSHCTFWVITKMEVYILNVLLCLWIYHLYFKVLKGSGKFSFLLMGIVAGWAAGTHQLTFIIVLPIAVHAVLKFRWSVFLVILGFLAGIFPLYPGILHGIDEHRNILELFRFFLTGTNDSPENVGWERSFFQFRNIIQEKSSVILLMLSFIGMQILGVRFPKTLPARLLWFAAVLNFIFAVSYNVKDRFTFFLPGAVIFSILGVIYLQPKVRSKNLLLLAFSSPAVLLFVYGIYFLGFITKPDYAELPERDYIRYFMAPYLGDDSAEKFVDTYEEIIPEQSIVLADPTPEAALLSAQAVGKFKNRELKIYDCTYVPDFKTDKKIFVVRLDYCRNAEIHYHLRKLRIGYEMLRK